MNKQEVIDALVEHRFLQSSEAEELAARIPDGVSFNDFIGVLKTELEGVSSADLADAMGISVSQLNGIQRITAAQAGIEGEAIGGVVGFIGDILGSRAPLGSVEGKISSGQEPFDGNETRRLLTEKFNELKLAGEFTRREEVDFEYAIQSVKTREHVDRILGEMVTAGVDPEDLGELATEFKASATTQAGIDDEARFIAENQPTYGGQETLTEQQQIFVDAGLTPSGEGWDEIAGGIFGAGEDEIKGPDRLRYYKDEDFILDRTTGKVFSESQWQALKLSSDARDNYAAVLEIGEVAQGLLESGKFTEVPTSRYPLERQTRPTSKPEYIWKTEGHYDTATGRYVTKRVRVKNPDWKNVTKNFLPIEDIAMPSPVITEAWQAPSYDYNVGGGRAEWLQFTPRQRAMRVKYMEDQGILQPEQVEAMGGYAGTPLNFAVMDIWENVSAVSSQLQYSQFDAMNAIGVQIAMNRSIAASSGRRSGGSRGPTYSVPASLRETPDYKTLAERTKSVFESELGRELEDYELALLSDELDDKYRQSNRQRIDIHKAWWDDSVAGGSTDVDFTEVEEPEEGLLYDIGEKYENEINRNVRVEDRAGNRRLLMDSIAVGERMT